MWNADNGLMEHTDPDALQQDVDRVVHLFSMFGLKANKDKTKFMVVRGHRFQWLKMPRLTIG